MHKIHALLFTLSLLFLSCVDTLKEEVKDTVPTDNMLSWYSYGSGNSCSMNRNGFVFTIRDSSVILGNDCYSLDIVAIDSIGNELYSTNLKYPYQFVELVESYDDGSCFVNLFRMFDGGMQTENYCLKLNSSGDVVWVDSITTGHGFAWPKVSKDKSFVVRTYDSLVVYSDIKNNTNSYISFDREVGYNSILPITFIGENIVLRYLGNKDLTCLNKNGDTLWINDLGNHGISSGLHGVEREDDFLTIGYKSSMSHYHSFSNATGELNESISIYDGVFSTFKKVYLSDNDLIYTAGSSFYQNTLPDTGTCIVKSFDLHGNVVDSVAVGKSVNVTNVYDIQIINGKFFLNVEISRDGHSFPLLFKTDLDSECYLDSINIDSLFTSNREIIKRDIEGNLFLKQRDLLYNL